MQLPRFLNSLEKYLEFVNLLIKLDHRLGETKGKLSCGDTKIVVGKTKKKESEPKSQEGIEPMQIGEVRGPQSKEEKERKKKLILCFY